MMGTLNLKKGIQAKHKNPCLGHINDCQPTKVGSIKSVSPSHDPVSKTVRFAAIVAIEHQQHTLCWRSNAPVIVAATRKGRNDLEVETFTSSVNSS